MVDPFGVVAAERVWSFAQPKHYLAWWSRRPTQNPKVFLRARDRWEAVAQGLPQSERLLWRWGSAERSFELLVRSSAGIVAVLRRLLLAEHDLLARAMGAEYMSTGPR